MLYVAQRGPYASLKRIKACFTLGLSVSSNLIPPQRLLHSGAFSNERSLYTEGVMGGQKPSLCRKEVVKTIFSSVSVSPINRQQHHCHLNWVSIFLVFQSFIGMEENVVSLAKTEEQRSKQVKIPKYMITTQ